jgi:hypothetical protein
MSELTRELRDDLQAWNDSWDERAPLFDEKVTQLRTKAASLRFAFRGSREQVAAASASPSGSAGEVQTGRPGVPGAAAGQLAGHDMA